MSQENVEIVRRFLTGINEGHLDAALTDIADDALLDWSRSEAPDSGIHRGRDAWRAWMTSRSEGLIEARFDPTEVIEVPPDTVVVVAHMRGRGRASGIETSGLGAAVCTLRDGRIARLTLYQAREEALDAVGLAG